MNRINFIPATFIASVLLFASFQMTGQTLVDNVVNCFRQGDAASLSAFFNSTVDIGLPGKDQDYSKVQAEMVMKDFFRTHPCKEFKIEQQGNSEPLSQFILGSYKTGEETYQVLIILKKATDRDPPLIHKIKFEK
jgi:hypothetical protein